MKKLYLLSLVFMVLGSCSLLQGPMEFQEEEKGDIYLIFFEENGGTGKMNAQKAEAGKKVRLNANVFTKVDQYFIGWATSPDGDKVYNNKDILTMENSDITLYAKWGDKPIYTITFEPNHECGITGDMASQSFYEGESKNLEENKYVSKESSYFDFIGWGEKPEGPVKYEDKALYTMGESDVTLYAQWQGKNGILDYSFKSKLNSYGYVRYIVVQPDGKILIAGNFTEYNGTAVNGFARLNPDGTLDTSFNQGGAGANLVSRFALQPDGKILIGGSFTEYNGTAVNGIARLNRMEKS